MSVQAKRFSLCLDVAVSGQQGNGVIAGNSNSAEMSGSKASDDAAITIIGNPVFPGSLQAITEGVGPSVREITWTVDGKYAGTGDFLLLTEDMVGKAVIVEMEDDEDENGESDRLTSGAVTVQEDFQNISREENENSYLKQFGQFSAHQPGLSDRLFTPTWGSYARLKSASRLEIDGEAATAGVPPVFIQSYLRRNGSSRVFSNANNFAVLVQGEETNQLLVWGSDIPDDSTYSLENIKAVYANERCFAFIYNSVTAEDNHLIGVIGAAGYGNVIPDVIHTRLLTDAPVAIYATERAFAVRTTKGKVYAWGPANYGGEIDAATQETLNSFRITKIISNVDSFCAISSDGDVVTWGGASNGGVIPADTLEKISDDGGALTVIAAARAFAALTRDHRRAYAWGDRANGGEMNANAASLASRGNIMLCKAASWAFCIVNNNGQIESWGNSAYGGAYSAVSNDDASTPQTSSVSEQVRRDVENLFAGSNFAKSGLVASRSYISLMDTSGIINIYANDASFCIIGLSPTGATRDVICWGESSFSNLTLSTRQLLKASRIEQFTSTSGAYAAVLKEGDFSGGIVAWGRGTTDAGVIPDAILSVLEKGSVQALYAVPTRTPLPSGSTTVTINNTSSLVARMRDGRFISWGGVLTEGLLTEGDDNHTH